MDDTVNPRLTHRELTKDILASEETLRAAGVDFSVRALPEVKVKGKSAPVRTFALEAMPGDHRTESA